jgi:hypothetical protein
MLAIGTERRSISRVSDRPPAYRVQTTLGLQRDFAPQIQGFRLLDAPITADQSMDEHVMNNITPFCRACWCGRQCSRTRYGYFRLSFNPGTG